MSSSSFAVDSGSGVETLQQEASSMLLQTDEDMMMEELQSNFTNYQNLDENSPGTIIFSPQDMKPTQGKSGTTGRQNRPRKHQKMPDEKPLTALERKAEIVADNLEKIKDKNSPVACSYCGKVMMSGKTLEQHMSIHAEFKPFQCPHCDKSFTRKVQLQGHLVVHGIEKQYECPVCHQRFSRRDCVKIHMRIHDKSKCALCQVCHKSFLTVGALNIHMRIHRGEKPFKCHLCGKCFTQKNHLITHIKRHTHVKEVQFTTKKLGPRMFKCEHCSRSFIRLSDYERHVQWNHGAIADINNVNANLSSGASASGDSIHAPISVMEQKRKSQGKTRKNVVVMCSSSTQTDESGGHVIIPRKYKTEFGGQDEQSSAASASQTPGPNETPRHVEEDAFDAYDEGMDRNYSSDEEETDQQPQHEKKLENTDSNTCDVQQEIIPADPAQDAAFDAMINNIPLETKKPTKSAEITKVTSDTHILPHSLNSDQPQERVFVIQNENNEPVVTSAQVVNTAPKAFSGSDSDVKKDSNTDLNTHVDNENFVDMMQNSYDNLNRKTQIMSQTLKKIQNKSMDGKTPYSGYTTTTKKGRPKSKPSSEIKGATALHLIRRNLKNFISDSHDEAKIPQEVQEELKQKQQNESINQDMDENITISEMDEAIEEQVAGPRGTPRRKAAAKLHGKDFLCTNKACKLCQPQIRVISNENTICHDMVPGTVFRAQEPSSGKFYKVPNSSVKQESIKIKKEYNLSEMAAEGNKKYIDMVNLLNHGGKILSPIKQQDENAADNGMVNQTTVKPALKFVESNNPSKTSNVLLTDDQIIEIDPQSVDNVNSIVSPPVDVQSFCIPTYSCKLCGREFRFEGKLHRHIESVHQKKSLYSNDVKPGRGIKFQYADYNKLTVEEMLGGMDNVDNQTLYMSTIGSVIELPEGGSQDHGMEGIEMQGDEMMTEDGAMMETGAGVVGGGTHVITNPEIEALRSEWDDDDEDDGNESTERPPVTKPQAIYSAKAEQKQDTKSQHRLITQQMHHVQRGSASAMKAFENQKQQNVFLQQRRMQFVTKSIQPMTTSVTDVYSGGVVMNMNKLTGIVTKTEPQTSEEQEKMVPTSSSSSAVSRRQSSIEESTLDSKCQKLLLKLFNRDLLMECGLNKDHVSVVLGRVLQHYGVKMIEDYGQGQYEVLKYNLWRLMEWKVTIEQMEQFYSESKTVEEMMDDIMNERVPLVPHEVITEAQQQQQQVEEMLVQQEVEGEHVVMHHTGGEHMIVDQTQHIVVQTSQHQGEQQIVIQGAEGTTSQEAAMIVQQVMGNQALSGVTQVVLAHDVSPEMLQGAHIVTIDPTTGQLISQVAADQMVLTTAPDGTTIMNNASGQVTEGGDQPIVVSQEQMMLIQQPEYVSDVTQHQPSSSAS